MDGLGLAARGLRDCAHFVRTVLDATNGVPMLMMYVGRCRFAEY